MSRLCAVVRALLTGVWLLGFTSCHEPAGTSDAAGDSTITFNRHIAPILFEHCAPCHRPGQAAPFNLLTYQDARKRAGDLVEVVTRRIMPPWLPDPAVTGFKEERRLGDASIELIRRWAESGAIEGRARDLPRLPRWKEGWQLGQPDLVLHMPLPYRLEAEGRDEYRHFVIPNPVAGTRYVRAVEFNPGNARIVHHAVIQVDRTGSSRQLDDRDPTPGFSGLMSPGNAHPPDGQFIGWAPGKSPDPGRDGVAWRLNEGDDVVLQLHLRRTGKPEMIQSSIGLYFAKGPPAQRLYSLVLRNKDIDIPAGESHHVIRAEYRLPVDATLLAIHPHAHSLARTMNVRAALPDGSQSTLIAIPEWNFDWQDQYVYRDPQRLPAGTTVTMEYRFDNSSENPRNPASPPNRVTYGRNATDEMAELLLQVVPDTAEDFRLLAGDVARRALEDDARLKEARLKKDPSDVRARFDLATRYLDLGRVDEAIEALQRVLESRPDAGDVHYVLGGALTRAGRREEAVQSLQTARRLSPDRPEPLVALAEAYLSDPPDVPQAVALSTQAVELTGGLDAASLGMLARARAASGEFDRAAGLLEQALDLAVKARLDPGRIAAMRGELGQYRARAANPRAEISGEK